MQLLHKALCRSRARCAHRHATLQNQHTVSHQDTLAAPVTNGPPEAHATNAGGQGLAAAEPPKASTTLPDANKAPPPPSPPATKTTAEQEARAAATQPSRQSSTINDLDPRRERRIDPRERTRQWVEALELPPELEAKMRSTSFKESSVQLGSAKQSQASAQRKSGWLCCFKGA